jgi:RNA polymerase sigma factor (sigma-70 family)
MTESQEYLKIRNLCELSSKHNVLTRERELEIIHQFHSEDPKEVAEATNLLVLHNLRLVIKRAKEFSGKGIPMEDLCQEGVTGIIRAVEKFEPARGNRLSTYMYMWIEQRMRRCIENKSRIVKIPLNVLAKMVALKKIYKKLQEDFNRPPTAEEIAALLGISPEEASELGRWDWDSISLDDEGEEGANTLSMLHYVVDVKDSAHDELEKKEDKAYLHALLGFLEKEDEGFLKLKYGLIDSKTRSNKEMGMLLKVPAKEIEAREQRILTFLGSIGNKECLNMDI